MLSVGANRCEIDRQSAPTNVLDTIRLTALPILRTITAVEGGKGLADEAVQVGLMWLQNHILPGPPLQRRGEELLNPGLDEHVEAPVAER
jgi:hypothetical protein